MKTWKTIALSVITTSTLVTGAALTYSYLQPSHYQGDTFKNEQSTSISNVSTNNSVCDNSSTTESSNSSTYSSTNYTESNSNEVLNYQSLYYTIGNTNSSADTYNYCRGFYYIAPTANLQQSIKVVQINDNHNVTDQVIVYGEAGTDYNNLSQNQLTLNMNSAIENAENFVTWLREQAPSGTTSNGLQSNYDYWVENCKYKYN